MADGTITIDTQVDTNGIAVGTEEVKKAVKRMASSVSNQRDSISKAMTKSTETALESIKQQTAMQSPPTQEYRALATEIQTLEERLELLNKEQQMFLDLGGSENDSMYRGIAAEIVALNKRLDEARIKLQQMNMAGQNVGASGAVSGASANVSALTGQEEVLQSTNNSLASSFSRLRMTVAEYAKSALTAALQSGLLKRTLLTIFSGVKRLIKVTFKAALSFAQMAGKGIIGGFKRLSAGILSVHKNSNKAGYSLGSMLKNGLLMGVAFRAFSGIFTSIGEGFQNLAKYSGTTNKSLSMLKSSLTQLKNSFATAFAPILNVIAPILSKFINMLSAAAAAVGRLFAALTGQKTFTKAVAVQEDYAASLEDSASGAKDAEKAMEGYLSPLDEINKLETKDNSDSGGYTGPSPSEMFEEVPVEPLSFDSWGEAFSAFLDYLLNTGIPALRNALSGIANTANTFSSNLYQAFSFPGVVDKVRLLGQEISNAFNDFVNWIDWEVIGAALGSGLNLAFQFLVNLIYTFDWKNLGASLAAMLNRALSEVDWRAFGQLLWSRFKIAIETLAGFLTNLDMSQVANALSQTLIGVLDSITGTLNSVNWQKLGNQIATFIAEIDYSGIAESLFRGLGAALASLAEFLWGLIELAWDSVVAWWHDVAYEDGRFTMQGLLEGILEIFKNIGSWIKEHIFQPFIDGFKSAFGINSPSTVMKQMGIYLIEGLFNGVESLKEKLINAFVNIKDRIINVWEALKSGTEAIWNGIKNFIRPAVNGIIGFINGLIDGIVSGVNTVIRALNRIRFDVDIPLFGNFKFDGFNLSTLTAPSIPYLASGAVIPPNAPFMAVLGDQRNGNNLEMPESLLRRIIREESGKSGGNETIKIPVILDGRQVFEAVINRGKRAQSANGRNPFELA